MGMYLLIFFGRIFDVSLGTVRINLNVRGYKIFGSLIAVVELIAWGFISAKVLGDFESDPMKLVVYAFGYAAGNYLGGVIEEKLAVGLCKIHAIVKLENRDKVVNLLKESNFGVSELALTEGSSNQMLLLFVKRRRIEEAKQIIKHVQEDSVIAISDMRSVKGGYMKSKKR